MVTELFLSQLHKPPKNERELTGAFGCVCVCVCEHLGGRVCVCVCVCVNISEVYLLPSTFCSISDCFEIGRNMIRSLPDPPASDEVEREGCVYFIISLISFIWKIHTYYRETFAGCVMGLRLLEGYVT